MCSAATKIVYVCCGSKVLQSCYYLDKRCDCYVVCNIMGYYKKKLLRVSNGESSAATTPTTI